MFIRSLSARNFGKLIEASYQFTEGVNIIRGSNEAGKTTLIEASMYAMFGSSVLRGTIEDTVTDGMKPSDLKVELEYGPYKVKRSKSSASVVGDGVKINGQGQVSNFFYDLLGIRKGTESSVLLSAQGKTAGILDGKPTEVSSLIESLAGFYQIDDLIENLKTKFPSGNKAILEEMLEEANNKLAEKEGVKLESPEKHLKEVKSFESELVVAAKDLEALMSKKSEYREDIIKIDASVTLKERLGKDIITCKKAIKENKEKLKEATIVSNTKTIDVSKEEVFICSYPAAVEKYKLYKEITSFYWDEGEWDGTPESLDEEYKSSKKELMENISKVSDIQSAINNAKRRINNKDTCETCGQEVSHLHEKINKEAKEEITINSGRLTVRQSKVKDLEEYLTALNAIKDRQFMMTPYKEYAENLEELPWSLVWSETVPVKPSDEEFKNASERIKASEAVLFKINAAKEFVETINKQLIIDKNNLDELNTHNNSMFVKDSSDLKLMLEDTNKAIAGAQGATDKINISIKDSSKLAKDLEVEAKYLAKEIQILRVEVKDLEAKLKTDSHNATILNQVRKAKPLVLNRVWSSILNSVSYTFSEMRGEESTVVRAEKGFVVNGLPVVRLSGSAKSILGIALRSSLRDIFAPTAGFMVFDEPSSDCDAERTASVTAALASVRGQVLTISHEDISDGSADQIIEL